ncbi:XVIPCD domain-containing protein [Xanthomonas sp. 60]
MSAELKKADLLILQQYATAGNRELYFNYLAQKEGNDGYGLLALGVVRNDNAPGATANSFAASQARVDGLNMSESDWQRFGVELVRRDVLRRQAAFDSGRPDLALNLPVKDIKDCHDLAFREIRVDPSAWTPYKLLEAARKHGGEAEADQVWSMLLDNNRRGLDRMGETTALILGKYRELIDDPEGYVRDMALARAPHGMNPVSNIDPDTILYNGSMYQRTDEGRWTVQVSAPVTVQAGVVPVPVPGVGIPLGRRDVTDPAVLHHLDDAHDVRQQREALRQQFHPDDPNRDRPIVRSPWLISDAEPRMVPAGQLHASIDFTVPGHPRHALWQQCAEGVRALDSAAGKPWDTHSACMASSLTALAVCSGLERVDHVVLNTRTPSLESGERVFVVEGGMADFLHKRAHMPTCDAIAQPLEQSFQQVAAVEQHRGSQPAVQDAQISLQAGQPGPAMSA